MNSCDGLLHACSSFEPCEGHGGSERFKLPVRIRELAERDRRQLLMHFLALSSEDRRARFGEAMSDEMLTHHVQHIDFHRDILFGAFDSSSVLIGAGHLAFVPRDAVPGISATTSKDRLATAGLSVLESEREKGIGTGIFNRMTMRCRGEDVDTIVVHCLADRQAMMRIARKIGMAIRFDKEASYACLKLSPNEDDIPPRKHAARFDDAIRQAAAFLRNRRR